MNGHNISRQQNMGTTRTPLGALPTNSPTKKRQKIISTKATLSKQQHIHTTSATTTETKTIHQTRPIEDQIPLDEWRIKWRKIILDSSIYFDAHETQVPALNKKREKEKLQKMFSKVGAQIQPFFDSQVTILITHRNRNQLPKNFLQHNDTLKIWDYSKAARFLKNLGVSSNSDNDNSLQVMLQNEKIYGSSDRDPNAKRDDFHYFKHPYFNVYDVRQIIKPVAVREWKPKDNDPKPWPHLNKSTSGHSLFQEDPLDTHSQRKRKRRRERHENNREYRDRLRLIYSRMPSSKLGSSQELVSSSPRLSQELSSDNKPDNLEQEDDYDYQNNTYVNQYEDQVQNYQHHHHHHHQNHEKQLTIMPPPTGFKPALSRQDTTALIELTGDGQLQASGFNASNAISQQSNDFQSKNGLAPMAASNPSKAVKSLNKQLLEKQQKIANGDLNNIKSSKPKVPGYCENCKIGFEDFEEHIVSPCHKSFAKNDELFRDIDDLIMDLNSCIRTKS